MALVFSVLEVFLEDITETVLNISSDNDILYYFLTIPREHTPRILIFVEDTVPRYCTKYFRSHFRLNKTTFERIIKLLHRIEPMQISTETDDVFHKATNCYLCGLKFEIEGDKVRNHNHITGEFFGAAHRKCNLQFRKVEFIPVILDNLRGFDAHLIMQ